MRQPPWIEHSTPNVSPRTRLPEAIILHHTGGHEAGDLATLCSPAAAVSADFYITKSGKLYKLNPDLTRLRCWHAGVAELDGHTDVNNRSIGIEMEHVPGDVWTAAQVDMCGWLCAWLVEEGKVSSHHIYSHASVARPVGRKTDPERFPWGTFQACYIKKRE